MRTVLLAGFAGTAPRAGVEPGSGSSRPATGRRSCSSTGSAAPPGTSTSWRRSSPGRRLLIPDLPGHGGSAPLPAASLAGFADVLAALLDAEGIDAGRRARPLARRGRRAAPRRPPPGPGAPVDPRRAGGHLERDAGRRADDRGSIGLSSRAGSPGAVPTGSLARDGCAGSSSGRSRSRIPTRSPSVRCTGSCAGRRCTPTRSAPGSRSPPTIRARDLDRVHVPRARPLGRARPPGADRGRLRVRPPPASAAPRDRRLRPSADRRAAGRLRPRRRSSFLALRKQRGAGRPAPLSTSSGCGDLNSGPLRPERSALPGCATPRTARKGSALRIRSRAPSGRRVARTRAAPRARRPRRGSRSA